MPKKKFIDKNNSVTFHLVHRSQQDPLVADENAPQHVLLPATSKKTNESMEERKKYGIYFDDDYNYLQHLKPTNTQLEWVETEKPATPKTKHSLKLPSSVFASEHEEDIGLLNRAAPQPQLRLDLDPDVVAAMDDDFDYADPDNELEDNFIEMANAEGADISEEDEDMDSNFDSEELDDVASLDGQFTFRDEETKSRFTEYSMSSSVIKRNDELTLLDNRFEKMYEQYDENEIGPLDCDEIEGYVPETSNILLQYADEFQKSMEQIKLDKDQFRRKMIEAVESDEDDKGLENRALPSRRKWDCESILSTHSNLYNHPKLIKEPDNNKIKIHSKTGIPANVLGANKLTTKALSRLNALNEDNVSIGTKTITSHVSELSIRPKDESPSERRERKNTLKVYRKERRIERKANVEAFKQESIRQSKVELNNRNNFVGNTIL